MRTYRPASAVRCLAPTLSLLPALIILAPFVAGQVSEGGLPYSFQKSSRAVVPTLTLPPVDVPALLAEDRREEALGLPFRFGAPCEMGIGMDEAGAWDALPDGGRLWRLRLESPGAYSINLVYDEFWLPRGARFFLYNDDESSVLGAFTHRNNKPHGKFATGPTRGAACTLEYHEPPGVGQPGRIRIARAVHGYKNVFSRLDKAFGDSGACNVNVNCPEGTPWADQIRSVAMILTAGGWRLCSGALVNNTRYDHTPFFLTANHCLGGEETWVIMFNYQSPGCSDIDGPTTDTVSGTTLRANNWDSDFALLELSEIPPMEYNVYYSGWSAVDTAPPSTVCIHHPSGDIKKITFDDDPPVSSTYGGTPPGSHWKTVIYELGTTEPGSSGSPLFDDTHRIIGQLHGGTAACDGDVPNNQPDYYGKVALSWNNGVSASQRLRDWLDPDNTGATTLDGINAVDSDPPAAEIVAPPNRALLTGTVAIEVEATDDVGVAQVEFFIDDVSIGVDTAAPYALNWNTPAWEDGKRIVRVTATDTDGLKGSDWIEVTLANYVLTCVAQAAPAGGTAPLAVTFTAEVSGGEPPYTVSWDFGDGSEPVTGPEAAHTYELAGTYGWVFSVRDATGGRVRCEGDVVVTLPPADRNSQAYAAHVTRLADWVSRIVLTNIGDSPAAPRLYALDADGAHLATTVIPELAARARINLELETLFPDLPPATDFWVLVSDVPQVEGVTVFGTSDGQSLVTMPLFHSGDTRLVFPYVYISDVYYTGLTLVNPADAAAACTLTARSETGEALSAVPVTVPARGKYVRLLDGIFSGIDPIEIRSVDVSSDLALVGFELFGSFVDQGLAGLPAVSLTPLTGAAKAGVPAPPAAPSTPTGFQGWGVSDTAVHLRWNANPEPGVHYIVYRKNGIFTSEIGQTADAHFTAAGLEPGKAYTFSLKAADDQEHLSPSSRPVVAAPLAAGETDFPWRLFYGAVPDPSFYYTGVTFSNLGEAPVTVRARVHDAAGQLLAESAWAAAPGEQITRELPALFGEAEVPGAAYLQVGADEPLTGFALFLTRPGLAAPFQFDGAPAWPWGGYGLVFPMAPDTDAAADLRLTNLAGQPAQISVSGYAADGTLLGALAAQLPAGGQTAMDLAGLFPGAPKPVAWLRVGADQPVAGVLLFVMPGDNRLAGYAGVTVE
jgi:PKD repeat protein